MSATFDETARDLEADFSEILTLSETVLNRKDKSVQLSDDLVHQYEELRDLVSSELKRGTHASKADIKRALALRSDARNRLRELQSMRAGEVSRHQWQAPRAEPVDSVGARILNAIGVANNEYLRGGYPQERHYVEKFVSEYVDSGAHKKPIAYVTSSGMAACTTVLFYLRSRVKNASGAVLAGKSTYFENKWLLEKLFPEQVIYFDEFDSDGLLALVKRHAPSIVFFDSLGNDERLAIPDLERIMPALMSSLPTRSAIVLDNSCLAIGYHPLRSIPRQLLAPELIVIESLNKFYEFGMDRVTGGVIWSTRQFSNELDLSRIHMGTIIPDISLAALPDPNRAILEARIRRVGRNASFLAHYLHERTQQGTYHTLASIAYPGLDSYPGAWAREMPFKGCFIALQLKRPFRNTAAYRMLISRILKRADERGIAIDHGTSFGFNTTRISVAALYSEKPKRAFIRIAVGTETKFEIEKIAEVIVAGLS